MKQTNRFAVIRYHAGSWGVVPETTRGVNKRTADKVRADYIDVHKQAGDLILIVPVQQTPTREEEILHMIANHGPQTAKEIANELNINEKLACRLLKDMEYKRLLNSETISTIRPMILKGIAFRTTAVKVYSIPVDVPDLVSMRWTQ